MRTSIRTCCPEMLQSWSSSRDLISLSTMLVFHVPKSLNHNPHLCSSSQTEEESVIEFSTTVRTTRGCSSLRAEHTWKTNLYIFPKPPETTDFALLGCRTWSILKALMSSLLWAGWNMGAILPCTSGFMQGSLNAKVCPGFHWVVFVILPETKQNNLCIP